MNTWKNSVCVFVSMVYNMKPGQKCDATFIFKGFSVYSADFPVSVIISTIRVKNEWYKEYRYNGKYVAKLEKI